MDIAQAINDAIAFQTKVVEAAKRDGDAQVISFHRGGLATLTSIAKLIAAEDTPEFQRIFGPKLSRPELLAELKRHHHELTVEEQALEIQLEQANKAICCQQESLMDVRDQRIEMQSLIDKMMGEQQPEHEEAEPLPFEMQSLIDKMMGEQQPEHEEAEPLPFDCTPIHDAMTQQWKHGLKPKVLDD